MFIKIVILLLLVIVVASLLAGRRGPQAARHPRPRTLVLAGGIVLLVVSGLFAAWHWPT